MKNFDKGDSPFTTLEHSTYNFATKVWTLANADTGYPKITITDPDGAVKINGVAMTNVGTGLYTHEYQLDPTAKEGWWPCVIQTSNSGFLDYKKFGFMVK